MLDPSSIDLSLLCLALDDRSPEASWWIDPDTGEIDACENGAEPAPGRVRIPAGEPTTGYRDMADFVAAVHHRRAADLLERAITGRGAFRRFKDTLVEFPELRDRWFRFRDARARRRALAWLAGAGLVAQAAASSAAAAHPDPLHEPEDLPAAIAVDLGLLYGDRLEQVLVVGSWVHAGEGAACDLELVVVLAEMRSPWDEQARMAELLWRHSAQAGVAVTALPVLATELAMPAAARLARVAGEAVRVG